MLRDLSPKQFGQEEFGDFVARITDVDVEVLAKFQVRLAARGPSIRDELFKDLWRQAPGWIAKWKDA